MISLSHVTITLLNQPIIQDLSLEIKPGSIHALMGPNGSGKSTLAATLMGHPSYEVIGGSITFNGENLLALSVEKRARAGLFLICQYPPAIAGVQVLTFLKESHRMLTGQDISMTAFRQLVIGAFDLVNLDHSFLYRSVHDGFSGGEKKRFEMAQLLLFKPKLAILDELDSGLDIDALATCAKVLNQHTLENPASSLLIITHYTKLFNSVEPHYVHILSKGKIWVSGDKNLATSIEQQGYDGLLF